MNIEDLKMLVNKHDPIHLIKVGAPDDEYQLEVGRIFAAIQEQDMNESELGRTIEKIFIQAFDETTVANCGTEVYGILARDILAKIQDRKSKK